MEQDRACSRRRLIVGAGLVALAMAGSAAAADKAPAQGAAEQANVKLVNDFLKEWSASDATGTKLADYMADDAAFRSENKSPVVGKAAITRAFDGYLADGTRFDIKVLETFARGPVVTNFRNETEVKNGKPSGNGFPVVGVFVVHDGKITEWSNYGLGSGAAHE